MKKVHASEDAPLHAVGAAGASAGRAGGSGRRGEGGSARAERGVGLGVMHELMSEEVGEICGPRASTTLRGSPTVTAQMRVR